MQGNSRFPQGFCAEKPVLTLANYALACYNYQAIEATTLEEV